jgi:hypothetical protein
VGERPTESVVRYGDVQIKRLQFSGGGQTAIVALLLAFAEHGHRSIHHLFAPCFTERADREMDEAAGRQPAPERSDVRPGEYRIGKQST